MTLGDMRQLSPDERVELLKNPQFLHDLRRCRHTLEDITTPVFEKACQQALSEIDDIIISIEREQEASCEPPSSAQTLS